jgi:ABC-2 type transport system permease protein
VSALAGSGSGAEVVGLPRGTAPADTTPSYPEQLRTLAKRSIARSARQPQVLIPSVIFPLIMMAILSDAGAQATKIPGFPTKSYITFLLASILVQGAVNGTTVAGQLLAGDLETGFVNRILLSPVRQSIVMISQLVGVAIVGLIGAVIFLLVAIAFGASVKTGVGGAFALLGVTLLEVLAFGAIGLLGAALTRSVAQVQGLFALFLGLLFMSSMLMPRNLLKAGWFKTIATYNPMSYLVEAPRSLLISGWEGQALALGCGFALVGLILGLGLCSIVLRHRMERA